MAGVGGRSVLAPKFKTVLVHGPYSVMNKRARQEHDWKICMAKLPGALHGTVCTYSIYHPYDCIEAKTDHESACAPPLENAQNSFYTYTVKNQDEHAREN